MLLGPARVISDKPLFSLTNWGRGFWIKFLLGKDKIVGAFGFWIPLNRKIAGEREEEEEEGNALEMNVNLIAIGFFLGLALLFNCCYYYYVEKLPGKKQINTRTEL